MSEDGDPAELARRAAEGSPAIVVAAGGDGTVSAVADALAGSDAALGVLPLGTLNHFATDLGLPMDLGGAASVLADGRTVPVDLGEVNGRTFVNNSSLGLYPRIVEERLRQQRIGHAKWPALAWATLKVVFRRHPHLHVRIDSPERTTEGKSQFVFVGNNRYRFGGTSFGDRDGIDDGRLSVFASERSGRLDLLGLIVRAIVGRLDSAPAFREFETGGLTVKTRRETVRVALDGEVVTMEPPLEYRIRRRALKVRVPREEA